MTEKIRVLFLFSDTGGGHRSAAEAIIEALHIEYGEIIEPKMVDFFKACPFPFYLLPELYGPMVKVPRRLGYGF